YHVSFTSKKGGSTQSVFIFQPIGDPLRLTGSGSTVTKDFIPRSSSKHLILVEDTFSNEDFDFTISSTCLGPTCLDPGASSLKVNPPSLRLTAIQNSQEVQQAVVQVTGGDAATSFTVGTIADNWLAVSPTGGALPVLLRILVSSRDLPVGV